MTGLAPSFEVPAEYFYALGCTMPTAIDAATRLTIAGSKSESALVAIFQQAIDDGTIDKTILPITPLQAARRIIALAGTKGIDPPCHIGPTGDATKLVTAWLASTDTDDQLWSGLLTKGTAAFQAANRRGQLRLILCALFEFDDVSPAHVLSDLVTAVQQPLGVPLVTAVQQPLGVPAGSGGLGVTDADGLAAVTADHWTAFLTANATTFLPAFTSPPGATVSVPDRIRAFLRRLQHFYTIGMTTPADVTLTPGGAPQLDRYGFDPLQAFLVEYYNGTGAAFAFGTSVPDDAAAQAAIAAVFPADADAAAWLAAAVKSIGELAAVTAGLIPAAAPNAASLEFSIIEALYTRGFTGKDAITALDQADFEALVAGSVAHQWADAIWTKAGGSLTPPGGTPGPFVPVNPDGDLANCIPPEEVSPFGPVAYLSELLKAGPDSDCAHPVSPSGDGFGTLLKTRRGDLAALHATAANLSTPIPLVDLVDESLEHLAAAVVAGGGTTAGTGGVVYDTAVTAVRDHRLALPGAEAEAGPPYRHEAAALFRALPEYSSPASPVAEPSGYPALAADFSSPELPYSQPLDVSRSHLRELGTNRFELLRHFRAQITEFVLASPDPAGFDSTLWRFPVRRDIASEYLDVDPAEADELFTKPIATATPVPAGELAAWTLYGFTGPTTQNRDWTQTAVILSEFLKRTGLDYCDFVDLWRSGYVPFTRGDREGEGSGFDDCPPCDPDKIWLRFYQNTDSTGNPRGAANPTGTDSTDSTDAAASTAGSPTAIALAELAVFIRLWRTLKKQHCGGYTFAELADICSVLGLFDASRAVNPDFLPQLAAFQMLRDLLCLPLGEVQESDSMQLLGGSVRLRLLALWDPSASPDDWAWAVGELLSRLEEYAAEVHHRPRREAEDVKLAPDLLDGLSVLASFDPTVATDTWHATPTCTLRFVEVLAKLDASAFTVGEMELLCSGTHVPGDDPFLEQSDIDDPLELPDDAGEHSLWALRARLLEAEIDADDLERWTWPRIQTALADEFGYAPGGGHDPLTSLAQHAFPHVLEREGQPVTPVQRRYLSPLRVASTTPGMWNADPDGAFRYDSATGNLWAVLPLSDEDVMASLARLRQLKSGAAGSSELLAVQELYWQPRQDLAALGFLFPDLGDADHHLLQNGDEHTRWHYFRHAFVLARKRCRIIAEHLARHADPDACDDDREHRDHREQRDTEAAWLVLKTLHGDENAATGPWEQPDGSPPALTWPQATGGAFAALLGLCGTGLIAEYATTDGSPLWRETSGGLDVFGRVRNHWNAPLPTLLPALDTASPTGANVTIKNGIAFSDERDRILGGGQGHTVTWAGVLLVEAGGRHRFAAGAPTPEGERPDVERAEACGWRIRLERGPRTWVVLSHGWTPQPDTAHETELDLRRGAYSLIVEFQLPAPAFRQRDDIRAQHTGFQLKYAGPDTAGELITVPHTRLFATAKTGPLGADIELDSPAAQAVLNGRYPSTLRDIRRTYQRAFLAIRLTDRFELSARRHEDGQSELGYRLVHPDRFAGTAFRREGGVFVAQPAWFDLDFLPVTDPYYPPTSAQDQRVAPSLGRRAALFDWWERLFDYAQLRSQNVSRGHRHGLWRLFQTAAEANLGDVLQLTPHLHVELDHNDLVQSYDGLQALLGKPELTAENLLDERWPVRCFHAERWTRAVEARRAGEPIEGGNARPVLWAAADPSAGAPSGNDLLAEYVQDGMLESGDPRRYRDLRALDDGLRERARRALLAYLCGMDRVGMPWPVPAFAARPLDLSDLLLLDVEAGPGERASRIEDAITAVQAFVRRARLHLEPGVTLSAAFLELWDGRFASFRCWQACRRRELYPENSIEWAELAAARKDEGFRFLEQELRDHALTVPVPAGVQYWSTPTPPPHPGLPVLQARQPSTLHLPVSVDPAGAPVAAAVPAEAFGLLGRPDRSARPSWLALLKTEQPPAPTSKGDGGQILRDVENADGAAVPATADVAPAVGGAAVVVPPGQGAPENPLPHWIEAAVRLGVRFLRVAAAGEPAGTAVLKPAEATEPCCAQCGAGHSPCVDEYYFWLAESEYYDLPDPQDADRYGATDDDSDWENPAQFPKLLAWDPQPMVHLHWSRVHNGEFGELRRSSQGVALDPTQLGDPGGLPTLELRGRRADSLVFRVDDGSGGTGTIPAIEGGSGFAWQPAYTGWTAETGWRYDLADDDAVLLPLVVSAPDPVLLPAPMPGTHAFGGLAAYPFFVYFTPGAPLLPLSPFAPTAAVADALRAHCRYEAALDWYRVYYDPFVSDNEWSHIPATPAGARQRASILAQLETLLSWGDRLLGTHCDCASVQSPGSLESSAMARTVLDAANRILGAIPTTVVLGPQHGAVSTVGNFTPASPPLNPRLVSLYERVDDRLTLVHERDNRRRRRYAEGDDAREFWGDDPVRDGWRNVEADCCDGGCCTSSPYRFQFLVQKALEMAGEVRAFGGALLSAYEKGDGEYLAALRASHERQMQTLALAVRKDQWRDADWQVQALKQAKLSAHNQLAYYTGLVDSGLNSNENMYVDLTGVGIGLEVTAQVFEMIAQLGGVIPDSYVGEVNFIKIPMTGSSFTRFFDSAGKGLGYLAQDLLGGAGLALTEGGWDRRLADWRHQMDIYTIEIERLIREILGAERRSDAALRELTNHQRTIEQGKEVEDFLRDKFTNHALYLFHQRETAMLYRQVYELAVDLARQAERAFNLERGHTAEKFVDCELWDDLHEGLLAGERLETALRRMEKTYLDRNRREYELTKHVSLRRDFPLALLKLKTDGECEIEIPEWMFDLDYPGQYLRRIKNVALTIPCVVGPYTGVHCRLTLVGSETRIDPRLHGPVERCCTHTQPGCGCGDEPDGDAEGYRPIPGDPRIVRSFAPTDAIVTSTGQNDSGMFELNFRDDRYLPFEFAGAVSRWRIELPRQNNQFDFDSIADLVLSLDYTAREGGDALRKAAATDSRDRLPGDGVRLFDVRHDFPDAWAALHPRHRAERDERRDGERDEERRRILRPSLAATHFPFIQGRRVRNLDQLYVFFSAPDADPGRHHLVRFRPTENEWDDRDDRDAVQDVVCVATRAWPGLFCGVVNLAATPVHPVPADRPEALFTLEFPAGVGEICAAYLLAGYSAECRPRRGEPAKERCDCGCGGE
ncbi:neuraminidase-like domain-containing protein [Frankia tisae]|uniref:Tc toxin subunit A-related protein n=1 Tax=Frankia tisae TaxID=2950104 RepID=UPI0021BF21AF|nr:neuraminidase-like domain-containing protein [Frankia tisae]